MKTEKPNAEIVRPSTERRKPREEPEQNLVPTKYQNLPSELAEEMWEDPIYVEEKINQEAKARRARGLAQIKKREAGRETGKEEAAQAQYDLLDEGQKKEFPNLQRVASLRVAEHIKGAKIENLSPEERFVLGKAEDVWKAAQEKNPGTPLTMTFDREIDRKVYANLLNRLAFEQVKVENAEAEHRQLNQVREGLGLQPQEKPKQPERALPQKREQQENVSPENARALSEIRRLLDRRIAKKPQFKQAQDALYNGLVARADKKEISELLMNELYHEKRTASYPQNPKYQEAWEYASGAKNIPAKAENGWLYRGTFPSKSEKSKTETRGSLNITITPEVVREMDSLIERGVIKANYKFGDPGEGGSAGDRHDAITIYFLEAPTDEAMAALSDVAKRNFRGNTLLGKKVSEGFYLSEIGSVSDAHAKGLIESVKKIDEELGKAVESYLTHKGRTAMSEAQFYAVKDALNAYGYDVSYDREEGLLFGESSREEGKRQEVKENPIELVESSILDTFNKFDLTQLILGLRKAAHLGNADIIESEEHRKELEKEFGDEYRAITDILGKLGLPFSGEPPREDNGSYRFAVLVGKDTENLAKVVEADTQGKDKEFGVLMGYPGTAVDAYRTPDAFDLDTKLPRAELDNLEREGVLSFLEFMPSKGHWQEELDYVRTIQKLVKEKAPVLYDEIVEKRKRELRESHESHEYDIPTDGRLLIEYARAHFGKFADSDLKSFKETWTPNDFDHFKQYMVVSLRTLAKGHPGEGEHLDNIKSVCRTTEEKLVLQRIMVTNGGSAMSLPEFDEQPFSKVAREYLGIDVEDVEEDYYKHFNQQE